MGLELVAGLFASSFLGTLTIGGFSLGQIGGLLLTVALTGAQYAMAALQKPKRPPGVDQSIKQNVRAPDAPQRRIYGTIESGGAVFFYESAKPFLYVGYAYNAGPIDAVIGFKLNGKACRFDTSGAALDAPFYSADGSVFLRASFRNGADDQALDPLLAAGWPTLPATYRQRGTATAVFQAHYGFSRDQHDQIYGNGGGFEPRVTFRGAKVYDPRDSSQLRDDKTTWKWSDTASLIIADYVRDPKFGRVPADRVDWESVALSADRDEEPVALAGGGWQKRYTINGVVDTSQQPAEVLRSMLTANRGRIVMTGGRMRIVSGGAQPDPVMTVHDGLITGAVEIRSGTARSNLVNRVKTEFIAPDREWQTANGPVYDRPDLQEDDGAIYEQSIILPFTEGHQRAQRLAKAFLLDARYGRFLTAQCSLEAILLEAGDVVRVELTWLPSASGLYTVEKAELSEGFGGVALSLSEYSDDIENGWLPDEDEQPFEISPTEF